MGRSRPVCGGRCVAFSTPAAGYEILSHITRLPKPRPLLTHVCDGHRRVQAELVLDRFEARVAPALPGLRAQVIHGDMSLDNVLFSDDLDGILSPPPTSLREAARRALTRGGLVVADEVQAGHGRSGTHLWSFQASGIVPDMVVLGKPMGNGFPVAALAVRSQLLAAVPEEVELFSTFGGNPVHTFDLGRTKQSRVGHRS